MECFYCKKDDGDLRPYGPKCAFVCFACAMETPEREKETTENFKVQFKGSGPDNVIGTSVGPFPIKHLR